MGYEPLKRRSNIRISSFVPPSKSSFGEHKIPKSLLLLLSIFVSTFSGVFYPRRESATFLFATVGLGSDLCVCSTIRHVSDACVHLTLNHNPSKVSEKGHPVVAHVLWKCLADIRPSWTDYDESRVDFSRDAQNSLNACRVSSLE